MSEDEHRDQKRRELAMGLSQLVGLTGSVRTGFGGVYRSGQVFNWYDAAGLMRTADTLESACAGFASYLVICHG